MYATNISNGFLFLKSIFSGELTPLLIHLLREPGIEVTDETTKLSRYINAVLNFARTPLVPLLRGAGGFAAEGLNYSAHNTY